MAVDINVFERSFGKRKSLLTRLGDAGRFLSELIGGHDVSPTAVKRKIAQLEQYQAVKTSSASILV